MKEIHLSLLQARLLSVLKGSRIQLSKCLKKGVGSRLVSLC